jgi:GTP-binding protein Era
MMHQVDGSIVDADLILLVTDIHEEYDEEDVLKNWPALQRHWLCPDQQN